MNTSKLKKAVIGRPTLFGHKEYIQVMEWLEQGYSKVSIKDEMNCSMSTLIKLIKRYENE